MKKEFVRPELIIIFFESDLVTIVSGGDGVDPENDENGSGYNYDPTRP